MTDARPLGSHVELDPSTFERLLAFIAPASDRGEAYLQAHRRVESFFRWRGHPDAARLADVTLDRAARRVAEGAVRTASPGAFLLGVARMVALEAHRQQTRRASLGELPAPDAFDDGRERRLEALERCLEALPAAGREMLLSYHRGDGRSRIDGRQALAARLGLPIAALRVRAFRLRERVERCVEARMKAEPDRRPPVRRST